MLFQGLIVKDLTAERRKKAENWQLPVSGRNIGLSKKKHTVSLLDQRI